MHRETTKSVQTKLLAMFYDNEWKQRQWAKWEIEYLHCFDQYKSGPLPD
jgi:hypothetical protein